MKATRVYISGPMSGMPEHNFPAFHAEAARLRALGYDVVNPAELNPEPGKTWEECMKVDLRELLDCDLVALLPDWEKSRGARKEMELALLVCIPVCNAVQIRSVHA